MTTWNNQAGLAPRVRILKFMRRGLKCIRFPHHTAALNLRQQLFLLIIAAVIPLLVLSVVLVQRAVKSERQMTRAALMSSVRTLAGLVDNEVATYVAVATILSTEASLKQENFEEFWREATETLKSIPGSWLSVTNPSGKILLHTLRGYGEDIPERRNVEALTKVFEGGKAYLSDLREGVISKKFAVYVQYPIFKDNKPLYMLEIGITPSKFYSIIKNKFNQGDGVAILDRQQKFVARALNNDMRLGTLASPNWRQKIAQSPHGGIAELVTLEGDRTLTAYVPTDHGWIVGASLKIDALNAPLRRILKSVGLIAVSLLLMSLTFAYLIARRVTTSMHRLSLVARQVGEGIEVKTPELGFREATIIGDALSKASHELKMREIALKQSAEQLEQKVEERTIELTAEMKRREESEGKVRQLQKMEAVGQLTGGIAHDFNNMMAVVLGSLHMMQRRLDRGGTDIVQLIDHAKQGAERAVSLTKRLLAFSRQQALSPSEIDVNKLIVDIFDLLRRTIPENIHIQMSLPLDTYRIYADANQLENAIVNLVGNARDAMPEGGRLTIETANVYFDQAYASSQVELSPGHYAMIAITDTGIGMTPQTLAKAFEPFFTTKAPGLGTGLGLSQVHGFIKQSKGHIKIHSELEHGVSIKIYLPQATHQTNQESSPQDKRDIKNIVPSWGNELILVVEDEPAVRRLTITMLTELGYTTLDARDPMNALALIKSHPGIKLLLTDVVMPKMNGRELSALATEMRPDLKILFTTGYTQSAIVHNGILDDDVDLIMKPFTIEALSVKLSTIFAS